MPTVAQVWVTKLGNLGGLLTIASLKHDWNIYLCSIHHMP